MENKEQILKILKLVEDGRLTPEEAEEIITAMKEAEAGETIDPIEPIEPIESEHENCAE